MTQVVSRLLLAVLLVGTVGSRLVAQQFAPPQFLTSTTCPGTGCVLLGVDGQASAAIQIEGTWAGTAQFEASVGGQVFTALLCDPAPGGVSVSSATAGGIWFCNAGGLAQLRVRLSAYTSGQALVRISAVTGSARSRSFSGGGTVAGPMYFPDGTSGAPAIAFASEPTLGFWRSATGTVTLQGAFIASSTLTGSGVSVPSGGSYSFQSRGYFTASANGLFKLENTSTGSGSSFKVDALPVYAAGFGAVTPAVVAGSTPFAGAINVGTGAISATGTVTFGGTAFPSTPFCQCNSTVAAGACSTDGTTTTVLTLTTAVAPVASSLIRWACPGSR